MALRKLTIDTKTQLDAMAKDNVVVKGTEDAPEVELFRPGIPSLSHWKMNDNAATSVVIDSIGAHNGIFYRGASTHNTNLHSVAGKINTALSFIRTSNDRIDCGQAFVKNPCSAISTSLWIYITNTDAFDKGIFYMGNLGATQGEFCLLMEGTTLHFRMNNMAFNQSTDYSSYFNAWHHIVVKYDGSYGYLSIDTVEKIKVAYTAVLDFTGMGTHIGVYYKADDGRGFYGNIDDVRIYDKALSQAEITSLYNGGTGTEEEIKGEYVSPATLTSNPEKIDAIILGMLRWVEELPAGTDITFATRTGSTGIPDENWGAWSGELTNPVGSQMASPADVYIQFRVIFTTSDTTKTPRLYKG